METSPRRLLRKSEGKVKRKMGQVCGGIYCCSFQGTFRLLSSGFPSSWEFSRKGRFSFSIPPIFTFNVVFLQCSLPVFFSHSVLVFFTIYFISFSIFLFYLSFIFLGSSLHFSSHLILFLIIPSSSLPKHLFPCFLQHRFSRFLYDTSIFFYPFSISISFLTYFSLAFSLASIFFSLGISLLRYLFFLILPFNKIWPISISQTILFFSRYFLELSLH